MTPEYLCRLTYVRSFVTGTPRPIPMPSADTFDRIIADHLQHGYPAGVPAQAPLLLRPAGDVLTAVWTVDEKRHVVLSCDGRNVTVTRRYRHSFLSAPDEQASFTFVPDAANTELLVYLNESADALRKCMCQPTFQFSCSADCPFCS